MGSSHYKLALVTARFVKVLRGPGSPNCAMDMAHGHIVAESLDSHSGGPTAQAMPMALPACVLSDFLQRLARSRRLVDALQPRFWTTGTNWHLEMMDGLPDSGSPSIILCLAQTLPSRIAPVGAIDAPAAINTTSASAIWLDATPRIWRTPSMTCVMPWA